MQFHAREDVRQGADRFENPRALVEHDALGPLAHRGVGDLAPHREPALGERGEDFGRPDDWDMGGFAQPENLFLNLGETCESDFDSQVPARDHDSAAFDLEQRDQKFRQALKPASGFDLQHDPRSLVGGRSVVDPRGEFPYVLRAVDEGEAEGVDISGKLAQGTSVVLGECRAIDRRIGKIEPASSAEALPAGFGVGDLQIDAVGVGFEHTAPDLAVVEPDGVPGAKIAEQFGGLSPDLGAHCWVLERVRGVEHRRRRGGADAAPIGDGQTDTVSRLGVLPQSRGPDLGPGEVHKDPAAVLGILRPDGPDDGPPVGGIIVSGVDPSGVHTRAQKSGDAFIATRLGGFGRHGDHDADSAGVRARAEERVGALVEDCPSSGERDADWLGFGGCPWRIDEASRGVTHHCEVAQHGGLAAPERGEPKFGKGFLKLAVVLLAEGEVMEEVGQALGVGAWGSCLGGRSSSGTMLTVRDHAVQVVGHGPSVDLHGASRVVRHGAS